jgi:hypothetical protein
VKKLRDDWNSWDTSYGGTEWQQSEGIVLQLLQQGLSQIEIRAISPVGGSRIDRLRKIHESGPDLWHTRRPQATPAHAFSDKDVEAFTMHCGTWILEDGFPCAHRRPRQYFTEPNLTWTVVHARYVDDVQRENPGARVLSYSRFTQYVHFHYPGVRLTRTAEDVCDYCVRLDIRLNDPDISEDEKQTILLEKHTHIDEAIAQRRFVSAFVKTYAGLHAPSQQMPAEIIPETFDSRGDDSDMDRSGMDSSQVRVQVQAEDFVRKAFISELFGPGIRTIWEASIRSVQLPRHPTKELSEKKMKSLSAKYFSIPSQFLTYYPSVPESVMNAPTLDTTPRKAVAAEPSPRLRKGKPGRPKKAKAPLKANQPSILQFFNFAEKPS